MGSQSDLETMKKAARALETFGVAYEMAIASAHRTPQRVLEWAQGAEQRGLEVLIAGAGMAAHLAGVVASQTVLPVIGVPCSGSALQGVDALYSTVNMPPGTPVATVAVDGAFNAGLLAVQILAVKDAGLRDQLKAYKRQMAEQVLEQSRALEKEIESKSKA